MYSLTPALQLAALQNSLHTAVTTPCLAGRTVQGVIMHEYLISYL